MEIAFEQLNNKKALLGVSGGVDSMVMLSLFYKGYQNFEVVSVNHNLRDSAPDDCNFVKKFCDERKIVCHIVSVDVPKYCQENKVSTETGARILRHKAFSEISGDSIICLAHNANDQAETVLLHLLRGSGAAGGCGMSAFDGKYYRPLLSVLRTDIENYAKENGIPFVVDHTNQDTTYTRNYLRNEIFPLFDRINANAVQNLCRYASLLQADQEIFDGIVDVIFTKNPPDYCEDLVTFSAEICKLSTPIASRALFRIFSKLGYGKDIEQRHINDIISLASKLSGKRIDLPHDLVAVREFAGITICPSSYTNLEYIDSLPFGVGSFELAGQTVTVSEHLPNTNSFHALIFDLNKIPSTAVFRTRREGDVFTKRHGSEEKLKDYLIDKKIPVHLRDGLILVAVKNKVLLIAGVGISDEVAVSADSNIYYLYL